MMAAQTFYSTKVPPRTGTLVFASQRRALRRAVGFQCEVVRERDFRLIGRRGLDISSDGMLVYSDERILTGDDVIVTFHLPYTLTWFDATATIARVVHGRRPTDRGQCVGLEFQSLDPRARRTLRSSLRSLPPPLPARERRIDYAASIHLAALDS